MNYEITSIIKRKKLDKINMLNSNIINSYAE